MAAEPVPPLTPDTSGMEQYHVYHAEAQILSGELKHPIKQPIELEGHVILEKTRREGHIMRSTSAASMEGLISFQAGHTRASGNKIQKTDAWGNDHSGWVTLSTSVIEGLNVFEVITADRVVAQVSTEHPVKEGHVPKVTFLGTRFENLRIAGYPVQVELDLGICGGKPEGDRPYLEDPGFLDRVEKQLKDIARSENFPGGLKEELEKQIVCIDDFRKMPNVRPNGSNESTSVRCSLVKSISPIPIGGIKTYGNIIVIPDFGSVALAGVEVGIEDHRDDFSEKQLSVVSEDNKTNGYSSYFTLNMLDMRLGCIGGGKVKAGTTKTNGVTKP